MGIKGLFAKAKEQAVQVKETIDEKVDSGEISADSVKEAVKTHLPGKK